MCLMKVWATKKELCTQFIYMKLRNFRQNLFVFQCGVQNFRRREACFKCGTQRTQIGVDATVDEISQQPTASRSLSAITSICCYLPNFGSKVGIFYETFITVSAVILRGLDTLSTEDSVLNCLMKLTQMPIKSIKIGKDK